MEARGLLSSASGSDSSDASASTWEGAVAASLRKRQSQEQALQSLPGSMGRNPPAQSPRSPRGMKGTTLDPVAETRSLASPREHELEVVANTTALLSSVKALPKHGNLVQNLVHDLRTVLSAQDGVVEDSASEGFLSANHSSSLNISTSIDSNQTTLGLILLDDTIDNLLPGAPAYLAGLRKGDRIVEVHAFVKLCRILSFASRARANVMEQAFLSVCLFAWREDKLF